jgi:hypothetical protein
VSVPPPLAPAQPVRQMDERQERMEGERAALYHYTAYLLVKDIQ